MHIILRQNTLNSIRIDKLNNNNLLILFVMFHFLAAILVANLTGAAFDPGMAQTLAMLFTILLPWFGVILVVRHFILLAVYIRPEKPISHFLKDLKSVLTDVDRIANGILSLMLMTLFVGTFSYFKSIIPFFNPFEWDVAFAEIDRVLHGGTNPYELLRPLLGFPIAITALNAIYHLWLFLVYFIVFLACFSIRRQKSSAIFLFAFVLIFAIGGNLLATVFSSAGPVYYERLGLGADFAPLMSMLDQFSQSMPVWALDVQETLWQSHQNAGPISGISAMPSIHVASSTLLTIYGFQYAKWTGALLALFTCCIMIGSVLLGWHYAIDGYFGSALAIICWKVSAVLGGNFQSTIPK